MFEPKRLVASPLLRLICLFSGSNCVALSNPTRSASSPFLVQQKLKYLFKHAQQYVTFYAARLPNADALPAEFDDWLASIPITTKDDVESHFPDGMTDGSDASDWRMISTRGTAQRLITVQGFEKRDAVRAAQFRSLRLSGDYRPGMPMVEVPPEICEVVCGDEGEQEQGVLSHAWGMLRRGELRDKKAVRDLRGLVERNWILNRKLYPGFGRHGSHPPAEVLDEYVRRLRRDRPYVLKALATYLVAIARHICDENLAPLAIPVIKTMGSRVTPGQRPLLERSFGGTYWDDYGSAEFGSIACECPRHNGLHVFDDMFIVEVVDSNGTPVADGTCGWILVTDLMNHAMPLIRYQIGDIGYLDSSPCACGRSGPRLTVLGRAHDVLVTPKGQWRTHDDVVDFCQSFPGVHACVVDCLKNDRYNLTVVADRRAALDKDAFAQAFGDWAGTSGRVSVRMATTIPAEAGGKFRFVRGNLVSNRVNA